MWTTAQQRFYMYTLSSFLELAGKHLGQKVPADVVKEVKEHEQEQKALADAKAADLARLKARRDEVSRSLLSYQTAKEQSLDRLALLEKANHAPGSLGDALQRLAGSMTRISIRDAESSIDKLKGELADLDSILLSSSLPEE
jgi:hypothetical protein